MKKGGLLLLTLMGFFYLFTGVLFAQTTPDLAIAGKASVQSTTPTPTTSQPTGNPTPTKTQPAPTAQVTPTPTPQTETANPTNAPQTAQTTGPTATPTPKPPTPTAKPKLVMLPITHTNNKPPARPINNIITAPFDLVMNSLPQSYYNDEGLEPQTNKILLLLAFLCLLSGIILLKWPALVRSARRMFAPRIKPRSEITYLPGRA